MFRYVWMLIFKHIRFKLQYLPIGIQFFNFFIFCQANRKLSNILRCRYSICKYLNYMNAAYIGILFRIIYKSFPLILSHKMQQYHIPDMPFPKMKPYLYPYIFPFKYRFFNSTAFFPLLQP